MFEIYDGRSSFYQWDLNRKIIVKDESINQVHFCNGTDECALVVDVYEEDGKRIADVPDVLLQTARTISVFGYCGKCFTKQSARFFVIPRRKPSDYVYYNGAEEAIKSHNAELLALTGGDKETAEDAITSINADLAEALTGKGVAATAEETTTELVEKVGQIEDWVLAESTQVYFSSVDLYDESALKHYPNITLPKATSCDGMFGGNKAVETIGDIYAPKATSAKGICARSYVRQIGRIVLPRVWDLSSAFSTCYHLERIEEIIAPNATSYNEAFYGNVPLKYIGGELDFTNVTRGNSFHCTAIEQIGFVKGSIHISVAFAGCSKLNDASIQSIIDGLADLTGQTQQTVQFHSAVMARIPDELKIAAIMKNWIVL